MWVDPWLCDYEGWFDQLPGWMTMEEMSKAGVPIDNKYMAVEPQAAMRNHKSDSYEEFQTRAGSDVHALLNRSKGDILLVTHATTMDAIARSFSEAGPNERKALGLQFPFCAVVVFEQNEDGKWKLVDDAMSNDPDQHRLLQHPDDPLRMTLKKRDQRRQ